MKTEYYIQSGQVITSTKDAKPNGLFSLTKFFRKMLDRYHVAYNNDCCDAGATGVNSPLRFNDVTNKIQYYNFTNNTWTDLSSF